MLKIKTFKSEFKVSAEYLNRKEQRQLKKWVQTRNVKAQDKKFHLPSVPLTFPVPRWHHTQLLHMLQYYWLSFLHWTLYPRDSFVTIDLYFSVLSPRASPPFHQSVLCASESASVLFVSWHYSLDSTGKWNHTALVFLWLTCLT